MSNDDDDYGDDITKDTSPQGNVYPLHHVHYGMHFTTKRIQKLQLLFYRL